MNEPIVIENLTKYYNNFLALDNVSLKIEGNENVGFLGPNGAGKSTTLKILCGLIRATSGKAYIKGFEVSSQKEKALSQIGTIIETPEFYGFLTPRETLNYFGRLRGMRGSHLTDRIGEVIGLVSLEQWLNVKIEKFSRGMKQRLALAQTLLHDPPILILDEPALGLDPRAVIEFRQIITEAGKDKVVFFASHQLSEVAQICKHVAIIDHGKLLGYDSIEALEQKYGTLENAYLQLTGVPGE
ncbi:MAG: ABC transporter ATP-binding protein [Dehalococcoidales bacterium]|nr:ABC transporter ATP-binding protein [Dehalococcoidales bacterium]